MIRISGSGSWRAARRGGILVLAALTAGAGCARKADFTLHQPFAPPAQRNLKLVSESAFYAPGAERCAYALTFPLPGAADGPRAFVVYLTAPGDVGRWPATPEDAQAVRGFLIQELGTLAGRSNFVAGTLDVRKVLLFPRLRRLDVNLRTDDGAEFSGRGFTEHLPRGVQAIEREFAADVALLTPPSADSDEESSESAEPSADE